MSNQILLIAGIGVALFLMSSQGTDKIIKGNRPELPVEMPIFQKQAVPLSERDHLGTTPYIMPSPLSFVPLRSNSNLGRDSGSPATFLNMRKMGFYSSY